MSMRELLERLEETSGPNAMGEYWAKCPAHDDKHKSLAVTQRVSRKDGKEKLLLCCHAGCSYKGVLASLGIKADDMIVTP